MKKYIILLISIIIDGLIPNLTLYNFNNITYFAPLCTIISLVIIYEDRFFVRLLFLTSIIYSGLYINNLLLSFILFFIVLVSIKYLKKMFEDNLFTILLEFILIICIYEFIFFIITSFVFFDTLNFNNYFYKVTHSLLFNLLYGVSIFYLYNKKSSKFNY